MRLIGMDRDGLVMIAMLGDGPDGIQYPMAMWPLKYYCPSFGFLDSWILGRMGKSVCGFQTILICPSPPPPIRPPKDLKSRGLYISLFSLDTQSLRSSIHHRRCD